MTEPYIVPPVFIFDKPASAIFSMVCFCTHLFCLNRYLAKTKPLTHVGKKYPFHFLWTGYSYCWLAAWVGASIFHTVENKFTEKLDYFSCMIVVEWMCWAIIVRTFEISDPKRLVFSAIPFFVYFIYYLEYMLFHVFDYGWHVDVCVRILAIHTFVGVWWAFKVRKTHGWKTPFLYFFASCLGLGVLSPLELIEFPPLLNHFDGHSLWHGFSNGVIVLYHLFQVTDFEQYIMYKVL
eukprot:GCRY01001059.1.p1 GENE.GCRY01001059.1~~GCRY01001059.1.p1  ORF type:complete len:236 (+),score=15.77 GCRY01001059.1:265-972(+)